MTKPERARWVGGLLLAGAGITLFALVSLGNWQLRRLEWKRDLIDTVERRAYAPEVPPPIGPTNAEAHAYLRVRLSGEFVHSATLKVKALTELGAGYWLMTPLQLETGTGPIWVNRGFVPTGFAETDWYRPDGLITLTGLVRISEPNGTALQKNDAANNRWFSRDISAFNAASSLTDAEDYFVDADHLGQPTTYPRGGMTRLTFRNTHLSYAITWYAMAALLAGALVFVARR
ncbi:MAG: SURF1 family cytochrome oxidase biogenesis protein [Pseudomonadota bacterium]